MLRSHLLVAVGASIALAACSTNSGGDNPIVILSDQAPDTGCVLMADLTRAGLSGGIFDIGNWPTTAGTGQFGYRLTPLVENFAVADPANLGLVSRRVAHVEGAHVDITFNDATVLTAADQAALDAAGVLHFDSRFAGAVLPNSGLSVFDFEIVPPPVFDAIKAKYVALNGAGKLGPNVGMLARIVIYGSMSDGHFESTPFEFPVSSCDGCLIDVVGPCAGFTGTARTGGACLSNQDGVTDCCTDASTPAKLVCPAIGTSGA